jgi:hypothetical protein
MRDFERHLNRKYHKALDERSHHAGAGPHHTATGMISGIAGGMGTSRPATSPSTAGAGEKSVDFFVPGDLRAIHEVVLNRKDVPAVASVEDPRPDRRCTFGRSSSYYQSLRR